MPYQVKDYMKKEVTTIEEGETVSEVTKAMAADKDYEGYVIVLQKGKPFGMVTERDIINLVLATGRDPSATKASDIMSTPLITIDPDEDLLTASRMMDKNNVNKLVVMRNEILYGIVTEKIIAHRCGNYIDQSVKDIIRWSAPLSVY